MNRKILLIATLLIMSFILVGCENDGIIKEKDGREYKTVNEIILPMSYVKTLNPVSSTDEDTYFISKLVYDGLFRMDKNMTPVENLAKNYYFEKNDKSVTVTLNSANWHDGEKFTGDDVIFSIEAHKAAGNKSQYASLVEGIERAEIIGSNQIKIYFSNEYKMNLAMLTFPIIPKHDFDSVSEALKVDSSFKPVGTGQYKYSSYNKTTKLKLKANPSYHGEKAKSSLEFNILPNKENAFNLLESSSISALNSSLAERETKIRKNGIKTVDYPTNQLEYIGYNFKKEIINIKEVRKAIAYAIDSGSIIEECYYNSGMKNDSIYFPNYLGVESEKSQYDYDLNKAEKFLKKAGFEDKDSIGTLRNKAGTILSINILVNRDNAARLAAAKIIKDSLEDLKISVTITEATNDNYKSYLTAGNFDIYLGGYTFDQQVDMRALLGKETTNYIGYENEKVTKLLDEMQSGLKTDDVEEKYKKVKKKINEDLPYYCVLYRTNGMIKSPVLDATVEPIFDNIYSGVGNWHCKYEIIQKEDSNN